MKRSLQYKLALLGCTSSCLMSAAYANTPAPAADETVTLLGPEPEITNIVCNAEPRNYLYFILNESDRESIEIESFEIITLLGDDYVGNEEIVYIDQDEVPDLGVDSPQACGEEDYDLEPGFENGCLIAVVIDPQELGCQDEHPIVTDSEIERALVVHLDAGSQDVVMSPIDLDVTALGTVEEYSLLADCILINFEGDLTGECKIPLNQEVGTMHGIVQVSQDVGFADGAVDLDDLILHDDAQLIAGLELDVSPFSPFPIPPSFIDFNSQNVAGFADAEAAFDNFKSAAFENGDECTGPEIDLSGYETDINPGIYCLVDHNGDNDYFVVDGQLNFKGNKDSLFVFVMPSVFDGDELEDEDDIVELEFETGADFRLWSDVGMVDSDNIIWVGADQIEFDVGVNMVGTFLTRGFIGADSGTFTSTSDPVGPAIITGRLISLMGCDGNCSGLESFILLDGNTILD